MADEKQNQYEAMFLLGPMGAAEPEGALNLCRGIIERHGGQIILIKKWDERRLAYEVDKQKRGTFIIAFYRGPGAAVPAIERDVKLNEDILRVMVLKADHLNEEEMAAVEPQPIQPREERPERDFRGGDRDYRGGDRGDRGGDRGDRGDRPERRGRREETEEAGVEG